MRQVREIAYTTFGRNALFIGLVSHVAALISAMISNAATFNFFILTYSFYWSAFIFGTYGEVKNRGYSPFRNCIFYIIASAAVLPVAGPLTAFIILYSRQGDRNAKQFTLWGMFASVMRLRANLSVLFLFIVILFVLFVLTLRQHDVYFSNADMKWVLLNNRNTWM